MLITKERSKLEKWKSDPKKKTAFYMDTFQIHQFSNAKSGKIDRLLFIRYTRLPFPLNSSLTPSMQEKKNKSEFQNGSQLFFLFLSLFFAFFRDTYVSAGYIGTKIRRFENSKRRTLDGQEASCTWAMFWVSSSSWARPLVCSSAVWELEFEWQAGGGKEESLAAACGATVLPGARLTRPLETA